MRGHLLVGFVVGFMVAPSWASPRKLVARPPAVLAKITLGAPAGLDGVRAFADGIQPGASAMLTTQVLVGNITDLPLDGLDLGGPIHVLYVDTKAAAGFTVVARVSDATLLAPGAMVRNGWGIVGTKPLVRLIAPWATTVLTRNAAPQDLVATVYPDAVLRRYRHELEDERKHAAAGAAGLPKELVDAYWTALDGFASGTAELVIRVDATKDYAAVDLAFVSRPRSRLAAFFGLQQPNDFSMLSKLPASAATFAGAGRLAMGPYRKGMLQMMSMFYGSIAGPKLASSMASVMNAATGEFAMTMGLDKVAGMTLDALYALDDVAVADAAITRMLDLIKQPISATTGPVTTTMEGVPGSTQHAGVTLRAYDTTTTGGPPNPMLPGGKMSSQIAAFDKVLLVVANGRAPRAIDAVRGKGATFKPTTDQAALFERSRSRSDSVAFIMDLGVFASALQVPMQLPAGSNLLMTLGFADGTAHFTLDVPSSMIRAFVAGRP